MSLGYSVILEFHWFSNTNVNVFFCLFVGCYFWVVAFVLSFIAFVVFLILFIWCHIPDKSHNTPPLLIENSTAENEYLQLLNSTGSSN